MNAFTESADVDVELQHIDPEIERLQVERVAGVRSSRDAAVAAAALDEVRAAASGSTNLLVPMREALRVRCTVGEICGVLRELYGTYDSQRT